jgi:hypothetical protein
MAKTRIWLRCAGNSSDSLAQDTGTQIARRVLDHPVRLGVHLTAFNTLTG